ncbi:MAG: NYN domain-containing protein [Patescibacteria group bacterium]
MIKHKDQRVGVFVDVQNMYYSAKNLYKSKVNFGAILKTAVGNRELIRSIAYVIKASAPEEQSFFEALDKQGFELQMKDLQVFFGGHKKGDWDIGMAVDAIRLSDRLDAIVLVTGDGDFAPLVDYLKYNRGCQVEVIAFGESCSSQLKELADEFSDLSSNRQRFLIRDIRRRKK